MKIGFIGAGRMATALANGIAKKMQLTELTAFDPSEDAVNSLRELLANEGLALKVSQDNAGVIRSADVVVLAVKPQVVKDVLASLAARDPNQLFVSVIAGTRLAELCKLLGTQNIVRAMPNTPCLIGAGATAYCRGEAVSDESSVTVATIFRSVGTSVEVSEAQMDAVTGLSGSGPAYVYTFIESLIDAGVLAGLSRDVAQVLAVQTVSGATALVKQSGDHPAVLRDQVTSPGGTTIHGMQQLEKTGFRECVLAAVRAAAQRSAELSNS